MKIKISENETYELRNKEEFNLSELIELVEKLKGISHKIEITAVQNVQKATIKPYQHSKKFLAKKGKNEDKGLTAGGKPRKRRFTPRGTLLYRTDRNEAVRVMKMHYFGKKEDKLKYADSIGLEWNEIVKGLFGIRNRFNITPKEIGISFYPHKGELKRDRGKFVAPAQPLDKTEKETEKEIEYY